MHGEEDVVVPLSTSKDWYEVLKRNGVTSDLKLIHSSHAFTKEVRALVKEWLTSAKKTP